MVTVTENGKYTASAGHAYSPVTVSVPQGVFPSGTSQITSNGIYDVSNFASASVNVPQPTGTSVITSNGLYNVTDFSQASVSVPTGITPSGTSSITANGIYDITSFASVDVNVSGGGGDDTFNAVIARSYSEHLTFTGNLIGMYAFTSCKLTAINAPNAVWISASAFLGCSKLSEASFPKCELLGGSAFRSCSSLMSLYFLGSSIPAMNNSNTFISTPMSASTYTGSFGSIYVPASLVDSYKTATNWSYYSSRITSYVE